MYLGMKKQQIVAFAALVLDFTRETLYLYAVTCYNCHPHLCYGVCCIH